MGLKGGGVRALENKGHAHLQYSVAVFLGGCIHSSHYTVGWSAQELAWVFWRKNCHFCQESTCVIVSSQNYL
jgi:hypothetical protein